MYVSAGLAIDRALAAAGEGLSKKQSDSLNRIRNAVESGQSLSVALSREIRLPSAIVGLISCGESSGAIAATLKSAHSLMERQDELLKKCLSALTYPTVIGLAAVVLTVGLVKGVMPQIIPLLLGLHADLPILTKIVIAVSQGFTSYGAFLLIGTSLVTGIGIWTYKKSSEARFFVHRISMSTPIVGSLVNRYALAIFFQSMGALVESGMPADAAFAKTAPSVGLLPLRRRLESAAPLVSRGEPLHEAFGRGMPAYIAPLVAAGEASGNLGKALSRAALILDRELDHSLKRLTALIEPIMMLGMGGAVGSIALSIMMPIYDISKALQH
jgi:type II secretory pathway component PulF